MHTSCSELMHILVFWFCDTLLDSHDFPEWRSWSDVISSLNHALQAEPGWTHASLQQGEVDMRKLVDKATGWLLQQPPFLSCCLYVFLTDELSLMLMLTVFDQICLY
jgi:hypothetical protein